MKEHKCCLLRQPVRRHHDEALHRRATADHSRWGQEGREGKSTTSYCHHCSFSEFTAYKCPWRGIMAHYFQRAASNSQTSTSQNMERVPRSARHEAKPWDIKMNQTVPETKRPLVSVGRQLGVWTSWYSTTNILPGNQTWALEAQPTRASTLPGYSEGLHPGGDMHSGCWQIFQT